MPLDPEHLYNIAPKGAGSALTLRRIFYKAWGVRDENFVVFKHASNRLFVSGVKNKEKPRREAERTMTYVSIHDGDFDTVIRQSAPREKSKIFPAGTPGALL